MKQLFIPLYAFSILHCSSECLFIDSWRTKRAKENTDAVAFSILANLLREFYGFIFRCTLFDNPSEDKLRVFAKSSNAQVIAVAAF